MKSSENQSQQLSLLSPFPLHVSSHIKENSYFFHSLRDKRCSKFLSFAVNLLADVWL